MSRCGNKAHIKYQVSSELVGKNAIITVERKGRDTLTASAEIPLAKEKNEIPWPDQDDGKGSYFGGRKVDWKGLVKCSYETKFKNQKFEVRIAVAGKKAKKSSSRIDIQPYANKGPEHRQIGLPMAINQGPPVQQYDASGNPTVIATNFFADTPAQRAGWVGTGAGTFNIEYKDGEVVIKIKLNIVKAGTQQAIGDKAFNAIKRSVESLWNDRGAGFRQWVFHRDGCIRGDKCNCKVVYRGRGKKEQMILGGCCKYSTRVVLERGNDNTLNVTFLSKADIKKYVKTGAQWPGAFNTQNVCYPEDVANSYAHEVGHMMGLPDEYTNGTVAAATPSPFPITNDSIMGSTMQKAYKRHMEFPAIFVDWINANVTTVKVIDR